MSFTKFGTSPIFASPVVPIGGAKKTLDRSESGERRSVNTRNCDKFFTAFAPGCDPSGSEPCHNIPRGRRKFNRDGALFRGLGLDLGKHLVDLIEASAPFVGELPGFDDDAGSDLG